MKGIILAGGAGTRLHPVTKAVSKQLLPVYDKPMIYYPLSTLMLAGIRDILVITTPEDASAFHRLLGEGKQFGINLEYKVQPKPDGIARAFIIGEKFIGKDNVALILGDNLFYGQNIADIFVNAAPSPATIFAYQVKDPERYGVVTFDKKGNVKSIKEKPKNPTSSWAVTGLYFYDSKVVSIAKSLKPSARGELEITDVNLEYLKNKELKVCKLGRGVAWLDTGTHDSLLQAGNFIQAVQERQGLQVGHPLEIAWNNGWIDRI